MSVKFPNDEQLLGSSGAIRPLDGKSALSCDGVYCSLYAYEMIPSIEENYRGTW